MTTPSIQTTTIPPFLLQTTPNSRWLLCVSKMFSLRSIQFRCDAKTQRQAAEDFAVLSSMLSERLLDSTSKKASKIEAMRLSPVQETFLVDWALNQEAAGCAPSKAEPTRIAQEILAQHSVFTP